ncbi:DNA polymerase III subunit delta [Chloroflexota bacterium]
MATKKPTPTFYIFHGDDLFTLAEDVARMRTRMGDPATAGLNMVELDGKTVTIAEAFNAVSALPFLSDKRLVIVDGWLTWLSRSGAGKTGKDTLKKIAEQLPDLPDFARLVFVERQPIKDTNPVLKVARSDPRGYVKTFHHARDPGKWLDHRAAHYGVTLDNLAKRALISVVGEDLNKADGELYKLAAYVGAGQTITEAHVAQLTHYVPEESVFALVDALGQRDGRTAAQVMHQLLDAERDTTSGAMGLFAMIVRQFRLLIQAREFLATGRGRGPAMAKELRVHTFVAGKLEKQSRNFTMEDLETIYRRLLDIDRRIKTGRIDPVLALDMLVAGLSE